MAACAQSCRAVYSVQLVGKRSDGDGLLKLGYQSVFNNNYLSIGDYRGL